MHLSGQNPGVDFGDVSERLALRKRLQCRSFRWYLEHVYPEMRIYNNTITYGEVRNEPFYFFFPVIIVLCGVKKKKPGGIYVKVSQILNEFEMSDRFGIRINDNGFGAFLSQ